ncbi:MAG: ATP-binding protein [Pseudomonadota bacterium]
MTRLHQKLTLALLAILIVLGAGFYLIDRANIRMYYEDLTQRLNAPLAMYIANDKPLLADGEVVTETLSELANRAMTINPTAEIYLLDNDGKILGHLMDPAAVVATHVDLGPIRSLLTEDQPLPIHGSDPRRPDASKVFSASPVMNGDSQVGYLYVLLGGNEYEAMAAEAADGYAQRMFAMSIAVLIACAFAAGALVVVFLTRRLRRLTEELDAYTASGCNDASLLQPPGSATDEITALRQSCRQMAGTIEQQIDSLKETDRLRRELVTNVSHDLRTPLASMQGYIETLLIKDAGLDATTRRQYLEIARRHADRLNTLVQDLFELAKLDANSVTPSFERFDLAELVHDVIQEFQLDAENSNITLSAVEPASSVPVVADIGLIQRVLENLVANALKFTPAGGNVTIAIERHAERVGVSIADTGHGIREEDLPRIFDRFYRAEHGEESLADSTGLGLAIAKRILELHDSRIEVTSELAAGTRFEFDLAVPMAA